MVTCPLCGFRFDPASAESACGTCPVGGGCETACCANCGYSFVPAPAGVHAKAGTLDGQAPGATVRLADPDPALDRAGLRTLVAYGLLPGATVSVLRTTPAVVLRLGSRTVSLDPLLAAALRLDERPAVEVAGMAGRREAL